jgi:hypothetical protein
MRAEGYWIGIVRIEMFLDGSSESGDALGHGAAGAILGDQSSA